MISGSYKAAIFDFDGTIVDSFPGIAKSIRYALKMTRGEEVRELESLKKFVGPPLRDSFITSLGMNEDEINEAIHHFRERYGNVGFRECEIFEGIIETLSEIRGNGIKTALASSKAEDMLKKITDDKNLTQYFDVILGVSDNLKHKSKADIIMSAMHKLSVLPQETVMIGDRMYDAEGAKTAGVAFIGALYAGYGSREEFNDYPYILLSENIEEIKTAILCR